jgi:predicted DsbA family dithiol-disulfide isomerase
MASVPAQTPTRLTIDVWADVVCPWCYIGEKRIEDAIVQSGHADRIDLTLRTFVLDPSAPESVRPVVGYLAERHGLPLAQAQAVEERMSKMAADEGLDYEVNRPVSRTIDMLRLVHLGNAHGVGWQYHRAMQREVFRGNDDAYSRDTLTRIGEGLGIPGAEIRDVLDSDRYLSAVTADQEEAVRLGARGVPFTVIGNRLAIPGAVTVADFLKAIAQVWQPANA